MVIIEVTNGVAVGRKERPVGAAVASAAAAAREGGRRKKAPAVAVPATTARQHSRPQTWKLNASTKSRTPPELTESRSEGRLRGTCRCPNPRTTRSRRRGRALRAPAKRSRMEPGILFFVSMLSWTGPRTPFFVLMTIDVDIKAKAVLDVVHASARGGLQVLCMIGIADTNKLTNEPC